MYIKLAAKTELSLVLLDLIKYKSEFKKKCIRHSRFE